MHIHISAICGTFMGGIAQLACAMGHRVTGSDKAFYPPMGDQLLGLGIELREGFSAENVADSPDLVIIGNALSRGNPEVESILDRGLHYISGPQWLAENVLKDKWVLAVAGTHGKTSTSSMLAWVLEYAGMKPGFLIGGVPNNFGCSARMGESPFFIVEADEYDSAFFDKRSKFVHYRPKTLVLNNLEFDHADIFPDLQAIKTQFHHLIRTVPSIGCIVYNAEDKELKDVLAQGLWSRAEGFLVGKNNIADKDSRAMWQCSSSNVQLGKDFYCQSPQGQSLQVDRVNVDWKMRGRHNVANACAAIAASRHSGVPIKYAGEALATYTGVKRRMEVVCSLNGITVYDDFAHHPTAVATTLQGLRAEVGTGRIIALLELRSVTMRMGYHKEKVFESLQLADAAVISASASSLAAIGADLFTDQHPQQGVRLMESTELIINWLRQYLRTGDHVIIMSNGPFDGLHDKVNNLLSEL